MDRGQYIRRATRITIAASFGALLIVVAAGGDARGSDDELCLTCHDELDRTLQGTPHALTGQHQNPAVPISCVSCHTTGDATAHMDEPTPGNILNPARTTAVRTLQVCQECHVPHQELDLIGYDPHLGADLSCVSCHSVHGGSDGLLLDSEADFCGNCHVGLQAEFTRRTVHPVADGNVTCLSCHDFTGGKEPQFGHGPNANCFTCHPEESGPFLWEHGAVSSFAPEGEGCVACHAPHGSPNERLLTQVDDGLCRQCHGVPPLHLTFHGGVGSQYDCVECHSAVHGSHDNQSLLDPNLGSKIEGGPAGCFCHAVDG